MGTVFIFSIWSAFVPLNMDLHRSVCYTAREDADEISTYPTIGGGMTGGGTLYGGKIFGPPAGTFSKSIFASHTHSDPLQAGTVVVVHSQNRTETGVCICISCCVYGYENHPLFYMPVRAQLNKLQL